MGYYEVKYYCPECDENGIETWIPDCEVEFGYPAPICSNPDDPRYSDPGCGPEICCPDKCHVCGTKVDSERVYQAALDQHSYDYEPEWDEVADRRFGRDR